MFRCFPTWVLRVSASMLEQTRLGLEAWLGAVESRGRRPGLEERDAPPAAGDMAATCLQKMIEGFADEVMIIGPDFRVRHANSAVLNRLGRPAAEVVGQPCYQVSCGADEPCHLPWGECPLKRVLETSQSVRVIHSRPEDATGDGNEKWAEIIASPIWDSDGHVVEVIELARDVSESKKLQREILRASRELLALNSISHALSQSLDLRVILQAVTETMLDALEAKVSWVRLSSDGAPAAQAARGLSAKALVTLTEAISNLDSYEQTATWASYSVVPDHDTNGHEQPLWQFAVTPLKSKGGCLGVVGVATPRRPFDQQRIQMLDAIGSQIALAVERCRLYEEVQVSRDLRGELLRQVIMAQEEERKRIARELHDETGQTLIALRLNLERLAMLPDTEEGQAQLAQCLSLCQQADEEVDKLIFDLRPALLDDLGLVEAIRFYAQSRFESAGIGLEVTVTGRETRLSGEREVALFRVVQEAITNIVRHSGARNAAIKLRFETERLVARIEDDGCGFEPGRTMDCHGERRGLGLLGMRERIALVGGALSIVSKPGAGTRLKIAVPLDEWQAQG